VIVMPRILMEVTRRISCIGAGGRLLVDLRIRISSVNIISDDFGLLSVEFFHLVFFIK